MGKKKSNRFKVREKSTRKRANPAWDEIAKENALMEKYYQLQHIIPDEEWETFMKSCRKDLPSTFRITKMRGHASDLLHSLREGYISKISAEDIKLDDTVVVGEGEERDQDLLLEPIKWYPDDLAWNSNLSRRFIRRSELLRKLHRFLVEDSECGAITRQEAVSMIPPMLLDVKPHHLVLDMCAAPGSKTAQLIEMLHGDDPNMIPTGAVIANDADHKRCYLLTHQANRLNTPCVIVTNHDATIFPKLFSQNRSTALASELLEFDRVLCDVPCSGDGTIRKNPLMWKKWTPHLGISLHRLQMRILIRGLELLKVGGKLVYSTCSFNPIENEAVLAAVLSKVDGTVALVDCSKELPGLERRPGMTTWKVFSRDMEEFKTPDEIDAKPTEGYKESMFPPSAEDAKAFNLDYCMRIFPHIQNTGGFFIAVLEKKAELPWQQAKRSRYGKLLPWEETDKPSLEEDAVGAETVVSDEKLVIAVDDESPANGIDSMEENVLTEKVDSSPPKKKFRRGMIREDPYIFLDDDDQELKDVRKFYGLSTDLPSNQFLIRSNQGKKRHIYLVSTSINKILKNNNNLKVINTGVRIVSRSQFKAGISEHGLAYRLVQDGVHLINRYIKNRIVPITFSDLVTLLTGGDIDIEKLSEICCKQLANLEMGCVVWHFSAQSVTEGEGKKLSADIWLCGHYGRKIVQSMLAKEEKKHFLRLLGVPIPADLEMKVKGPSWGDSQEKVESVANTDGVDEENCEDS